MYGYVHYYYTVTGSYTVMLFCCSDAHCCSVICSVHDHIAMMIHDDSYRNDDDAWVAAAAAVAEDKWC